MNAVLVDQIVKSVFTELSVPHNNTTYDTEVWNVIFVRVFGEFPKNPEDIRWEILFRTDPGGYGALKTASSIVAIV